MIKIRIKPDYNTKKLFDINNANSKSTRLKNTIASFVDASSIHGLKNIYRTKRIAVKVIWLLFIFTSAVSCSYYILKCLSDFLNFEYSTTIKLVNEIPSPFPAISICSYNDKDLKFYILNFEFDSIKLKNDLDEFESFNDTAYGLCYRFNSGRSFNGSLISTHSSSTGGMYYGFYLELYIISENDYGQLIVYIHNATDTSTSLQNKGSFISTGNYNYFTINRIIEKKLEYPYNDCIKDVSNFLFNKTIINYFKSNNQTYSQNECINLCRNMKYLEQTNCSCNLKAFDVDVFGRCIINEKNFSNRICPNNFIENFQKNNPYKICSNFCPLECETSTYVITHSTESILQTGNITKGFEYEYFNTYENVSRKFISMNIYYEDLKYTLITQQPKMQIFDLISNIGGLFGLFLGMGLLSFVELIEIFIQILFIIFRK